jgi:hypothetical protein
MISPKCLPVLTHGEDEDKDKEQEGSKSKSREN